MKTHLTVFLILLNIFGAVVSAASAVEQTVKYGETTLAGLLHAGIAATCILVAVAFLISLTRKK